MYLFHSPFPFQRGGGHQAGRVECVRDETAERQGREVCFPSRGQQDDEAYHQLSLQKQRGEENFLLLSLPPSSLFTSPFPLSRSHLFPHPHLSSFTFSSTTSIPPFSFLTFFFHFSPSPIYIANLFYSLSLICLSIHLSLPPPQSFRPL